MYDIAFISYKEPNALARYMDLVTLVSAKNRIYRIDGVEGIHNAHIEAAKQSTTPMFYVVDADAKIVPGFKFSLQLDPSEEDIVHVWKSINPINGLEYGFGGVKLLPTQLTLNMDIGSTDMTTSISSRFKAMDIVSNITQFNVDRLSTWRSSFRECVKLSSKIIPGQEDVESSERLEVWINNSSKAEHARFSRIGAAQGKWYGSTFKDDPVSLNKINDYKWLEEQFLNGNLFPKETFVR